MSQTNNEITQPFIYHTGDRVPKNVISAIIHRLVTHIPNEAFEDCLQLETIKLHKGVTSIGIRAFYGCINLKHINLHESSVEIIHEWAFYKCKSLERIKLPPSLKRINYNAFSECKSLIIINLSACLLLEEIDNCAFGDCYSLMAVYFPNSRLRIRNDTFSNCHSLISAELPPAVHVDDRAFIGCRTLELRQQQVDYNSLTREQEVQRSRENIRWLKQGYDALPIHKLCRDPDITHNQLSTTTTISIILFYNKRMSLV